MRPACRHVCRQRDVGAACAPRLDERVWRGCVPAQFHKLVSVQLAVPVRVAASQPQHRGVLQRLPRQLLPGLVLEKRLQERTQLRRIQLLVAIRVKLPRARPSSSRARRAGGADHVHVVRSRPKHSVAAHTCTKTPRASCSHSVWRRAASSLADCQDLRTQASISSAPVASSRLCGGISISRPHVALGRQHTHVHMHRTTRQTTPSPTTRQRRRAKAAARSPPPGSRRGAPVPGCARRAPDARPTQAIPARDSLEDCCHTEITRPHRPHLTKYNHGKHLHAHLHAGRSCVPLLACDGWSSRWG
jgi:hypothetical protein